MKPGAFPCLAFVQRAEALGDPAWASRPTKRELVFPLGEPPSNDSRKWKFGQDDLAAVLTDSRSWTEPKPVYYAHGEDKARGREAAGWIDHLELASDGLYAFIRYTDDALAEIGAGKWGYRSPGFDATHDKDGAIHPIRLFELSLVNEPAIPMPALTASRGASEAGLAHNQAAAGATSAPGTTSTPSPLKASLRKEQEMKISPENLALLGLAADANEEQLNAALAEKLKVPPPQASVPDPEAQAAAREAIRIEMATQREAIREDVRKELAAEQAKRDHAAKVEAAVEAALKAGKVTVAQRAGALAFAKADLAAFEAFAAAAPVVAPVATVIVGRQGDPTAAPNSYAEAVRLERFAAMRAARQ